MLREAMAAAIADRSWPEFGEKKHAAIEAELDFEYPF
jgi:hypothetical protein